MITDNATLSEIQSNWNGVEALRKKLQVSAFASVGEIGGIYPFALSNAAHNLPFIHAFSVLNEVLIALENEGHFSCNSIFLGKLLRESKNSLPWQNYSEIKAGVNLRNGVAHRGDLLESNECWSYIDVIKAELLSWHIV